MTGNAFTPLLQTVAQRDPQKIVTLVLDCACDRDVIIDELRVAYPHCDRETLEKYLPYINTTMRKYGINSCLQKMHFLAQVGHETSELREVVELLSTNAQRDADLEMKRYLGYKGRGLMQLTSLTNYRAYSAYMKEDFLNENRKKLEEPKYAADSAGWFWAREKRLNFHADRNDLLYITAKVNGGFNGYAGDKTSRLSLVKCAAIALRVALCSKLEALFSTFPEVEKFNYDSYPFERSKVYHDTEMCFGWGLWNDRQYQKSRKPGDAARAKAGYSRYLILRKKIH